MNYKEIVLGRNKSSPPDGTKVATVDVGNSRQAQVVVPVGDVQAEILASLQAIRLLMGALVARSPIPLPASGEARVVIGSGTTSTLGVVTTVSSVTAMTTLHNFGLGGVLQTYGYGAAGVGAAMLQTPAKLQAQRYGR